MMRIQKSLDTRCSHHHKKPVALVRRPHIGIEGLAVFTRVWQVRRIPLLRTFVPNS